MRSHIQLLWVKCVLAFLALPMSLARASESGTAGDALAAQSLGNSADQSAAGAGTPFTGGFNDTSVRYSPDIPPGVGGVGGI